MSIKLWLTCHQDQEFSTSVVARAIPSRNTWLTVVVEWVGVDESAAMLKIARITVPEAELVQVDMVEVQFTESFGAAIAWNRF